MKTALYVATVARTYRKAIDDCLQSEELWRQNLPWYQEQIRSCTYREFTTGFFFGRPDEEAQIYDSNTYHKGYTYLGLVGETERGRWTSVLRAASAPSSATSSRWARPSRS